jgi:uncharacterized repeat protein (TIGR03803 family)
VNGGANSGGTVFVITPSGALTTIYSFCSQGGVHCTEGQYPYGPLVQATDGEFYGTTSRGGTNLNSFGYGAGSIFKITPGSTLTTVFGFCNDCADGTGPEAGLIQVQRGLLRYNV